MTSSASRVQPGQLIGGRYRIESRLGEGGMGAVFAARDEMDPTRPPLALKVLIDCADPTHVKRFVREGQATMRIASDHVVNVYSVATMDDGAPYIVMDRLEGSTVKALVQAKPLDEQTLADYVIQACAGLAAAHACGIVHRDVKPSNLFVVGDGIVKVLDFGISKIRTAELSERTASATASTALLGSPHFISPEQLRNATQVDERTDVWSLGVVLYNGQSGKFPFDGGSLAEVIGAILHKQCAPLAGASERMQRIVERCLAREPSERFADVGELATALAPLASSRFLPLAERVVEIVGDSRARHLSSVELKAATNDSAGSIEVRPNAPAPTGLSATMRADSPTAQRERRSSPSIVPPVTERTGARAAPPPLLRSTLGLALLSAFVVVVVAAGVVLLLRSKMGGRDASSTPAAPVSIASVAPPPEPTPIPPPDPAPPPASASTASTDPVLELVADGPIAKVTVTGARRVAIEGSRAEVVVAPWKGDLALQVELADGSSARGVAKAGGPTTVRLTTTKRGKVPIAAPARPGTARPKTPGELQDNPYP